MIRNRVNGQARRGTETEFTAKSIQFFKCIEKDSGIVKKRFLPPDLRMIDRKPKIKIVFFFNFLIQ